MAIGPNNRIKLKQLANVTAGKLMQSDAEGTMEASALAISGADISTSSGNTPISLQPNGTGDILLKADTVQVGDEDAAATIQTWGTGALTIQTSASSAAINITPNGTGAVVISKIDVAAGEIDGTGIGQNAAAAGSFTALVAQDSLVVNANASIIGDAAGEVQLNVKAHASQSTSILNVALSDDTAKLTVSNAGVTTAASLVATTADINAGTIDATVIGGSTAAAGTFTAMTATSIVMDSNTMTAITLKAESFGDLDAAIPSTAAVKQYVDNQSSGLDVKDSVKAAYNAPFTMDSTASSSTLVLANGEGGFDAGANTLTIDGVATIAEDDRILVKDGVNSNEAGVNQKWNGVYIVGSLTDASCTLTRSADFNEAAEFVGAPFFFVDSGSVNGFHGFVSSLAANPSIGTDAISFFQFTAPSDSLAGPGLKRNGNVLELDIDDLPSLGGATLHQTEDEFAFSDDGVEKKVSFTNLCDSIYADITGGDVTIAAGGTATIAAAAVEHGMLNDDIISGQAELVHADIVDADELMISDNGVIKRVGIDSLQNHYFGSISGDALVADGGALTIQVDSVEQSMIAANAIFNEQIKYVSAFKVLEGAHINTDNNGNDADRTRVAMSALVNYDGALGVSFLAPSATITDALADAINGSGSVQVFLNGQSMIIDGVEVDGESATSAANAPAAGTDCKFIEVGSALELAFPEGAVEVGDVVAVRGFAAR